MLAASGLAGEKLDNFNSAFQHEAQVSECDISTYHHVGEIPSACCATNRLH